MDFQWMSKKANAGRFERGYLNVTTENLTNWTLLKREKPPKTNYLEVPLWDNRAFFCESGLTNPLFKAILIF